VTTPKLTRLAAVVAVRRCRVQMAHRHAVTMPSELRLIAGTLLHWLYFDLGRAELALRAYVTAEGDS